MSRFTDVLVDAHNGAQPVATARLIAALTPPPVVIQPAGHPRVVDARR
jgi:hypothetical protein